MEGLQLARSLATPVSPLWWLGHCAAAGPKGVGSVLAMVKGEWEERLCVEIEGTPGVA